MTLLLDCLFQVIACTDQIIFAFSLWHFRLVTKERVRGDQKAGDNRVLTREKTGPSTAQPPRPTPSWLPGCSNNVPTTVHAQGTKNHRFVNLWTLLTIKSWNYGCGVSFEWTKLSKWTPFSSTQQVVRRIWWSWFSNNKVRPDFKNI